MIDVIKKTKIRHLNIDESKRIIFVSDIHGDINTFKKGLEELEFCENDYLFIIGDMYEKGEKGLNLETARFMIDFHKNNKNVYPMAGNCDEVLRFIIPEDQKNKFLYYVNKKKKSIINDIADEMNYKISDDMNVSDFVNRVQQQYAQLYEFMDSLDDVIFINDKLVLVHGGIDDIDNIPEISLPLLKYDRFYELSGIQKKLMIVGHYPTRNYRSDIACVNPIFDFRKKIISIDGGNQLVKGGQINFVVLDSLNSMKFSYIYVDHYPKYIMKESVDYVENSSNFNIIFGDNEVEILATDLDFYYIKHKSTNQMMWVHNSFVYKDDKTNKTYCYDGCNQFISVRKNDEISIIKKAMPYSLIKRQGYIGLIETKYIENGF